MSAYLYSLQIQLDSTENNIYRCQRALACSPSDSLRSALAQALDDLLARREELTCRIDFILDDLSSFDPAPDPVDYDDPEPGPSEGQYH